jgi:hypothetical protein
LTEPRRRIHRCVLTNWFKHGLVFRSAETVHTQRPLQSDDAALDRLQKRQRQDHRYRDPDHQMLPALENEPAVGGHETGNDDMADDENRQIGRKVVGAVVVHLFATDSAQLSTDLR